MLYYKSQMIPPIDRPNNLQLLFQLLTMLEPIISMAGSGGSTRKALISFSDASRNFQTPPPGPPPFKHSVEILASLQSIGHIMNQAVLEPFLSFAAPPKLPMIPQAPLLPSHSEFAFSPIDSTQTPLRSNDAQSNLIFKAPDRPMRPIAISSVPAEPKSKQPAIPLLAQSVPDAAPAETKSEPSIEHLTTHLIKQIQSLSTSPILNEDSSNRIAIRLKPVVERLVTILEAQVSKPLFIEKKDRSQAIEPKTIEPQRTAETPIDRKTPFSRIDVHEKTEEGSRFESPQLKVKSQASQPPERSFQHPAIPAATIPQPMMEPAIQNNILAIILPHRLRFDEETQKSQTPDGKPNSITLPFTLPPQLSSFISKKKKKDKDKKRSDEEEREDDQE